MNKNYIQDSETDLYYTNLADSNKIISSVREVIKTTKNKKSDSDSYLIDVDEPINKEIKIINSEKKKKSQKSSESTDKRTTETEKNTHRNIKPIATTNTVTLLDKNKKSSSSYDSSDDKTTYSDILSSEKQLESKDVNNKINIENNKQNSPKIKNNLNTINETLGKNSPQCESLGEKQKFFSKVCTDTKENIKIAPKLTSFGNNLQKNATQQFDKQTIQNDEKDLKDQKKQINNQSLNENKINTQSINNVNLELKEKPNVPLIREEELQASKVPLNLNYNKTYMPKMMTEKELKYAKMECLSKLIHIKDSGYELTKKYDMNSDLDEMQMEIKYHTDILNKKSSIELSKSFLVNAITALEFMNDRYDPFGFQLNGWSNNVKMNIDQYNDVMGEISEKYKSSGKKMEPEIKLMLMLGGSAASFHLSKTLSSKPLIGDLIKNNPQFLNKVQSTLNNVISPPKKTEQDRVSELLKTIPSDKLKSMNNLNTNNQNNDQNNNQNNNQYNNQTQEIAKKINNSEIDHQRLLQIQKLQQQNLLEQQAFMQKQNVNELNNIKKNINSNNLINKINNNLNSNLNANYEQQKNNQLLNKIKSNINPTETITMDRDSRSSITINDIDMTENFKENIKHSVKNVINKSNKTIINANN